MSYGIWCVYYLGSIESCCIVLWSFLLVGHASLKRQKAMVIWSMIPHCLMWGIWREGNACNFEGNERFTIWSFHSFRLCSSGQMLRVFLLSSRCKIYLIFVLSFLVSFLFTCFSCSTLPACFYFHCIVLFSFRMMLITYQTKIWAAHPTLLGFWTCLALISKLNFQKWNGMI